MIRLNYVWMYKCTEKQWKAIKIMSALASICRILIPKPTDKGRQHDKMRTGSGQYIHASPRVAEFHSALILLALMYVRVRGN